MNNKRIIYAVYKGEKFLVEGTAKECAKYLNVTEKTIWYYSTPANLKRGKKNAKIAIRIGEEKIC